MNCRPLCKTIAVAAAFLSACASSPSVPAGMKPGQFVTYACDGGKVFRAPAAEDGKSVRVRALHGSAELDVKAAGAYEGEGYRLEALPGAVLSLSHQGKPEAVNCKAAG